MIANHQLDNAILELHPRRSLQYHHPLLLPLVVLEVCYRGVAVGDDLLDPNVVGLKQCREKLIWKVRGEFGAEVTLDAYISH